MPDAVTAPADPATAARDRTARVLMIALSLATVGAFANALIEFGSLPSSRLVVNNWQMLAYVVFGGLFLLLGLYPRRMPGLWELVFFQKAGVTIYTAQLMGGDLGGLPSDDPVMHTFVDATLVAGILISYVLARGWRAWRSGDAA